MTRSPVTPDSSSSPPVSPIPVALNFSGGISLGAFMAGIFYELIQEARRSSHPRIAIDIITGGSAGAITGTLAAYYLLGVEDLPPAQESLFYQAWVELVDIQALNGIGKETETDSETHQENWSVLSGKAIQAIANRLVGYDPTQTPAPSKSKFEQKLRAKPSATVDRPLALLVTLTNLQGLLKKTSFEPKYRPGHDADEPIAPVQTSPINQTSPIKTITSRETRQFLFHPGLAIDELSAMWDKAILSARASGAFPVAFPPVGDISDVNNPNLAGLSDDYFSDPATKQLDPTVLDGIYPATKADRQHLMFQYTDGGVLDGLPLVRGIYMAKQLDGQMAETIDARFHTFKSYWEQHNQTLRLNSTQLDDRLYVYVQPTPTNRLDSEKRLRKAHFSMLDVAFAGLTLPKAEHDAIRLEEVLQRNQDYNRKQKFVESMSHLLEDLDGVSEAAKQQIQEAIAQQIETAIPYRYVQLSRIDPSILAAVFSADFISGHSDRSRDGLAQIQAALRHCFATQSPYLQQAIDRGDVKSLLASDFLGAFGGFFDRDYREHDFLLGQLCGKLWLLQTCYRSFDPDLEPVQELLELIQTQGHRFLSQDPNEDNLQPNQLELIEKLLYRAVEIIWREANIKLFQSPNRLIQFLQTSLRSIWQQAQAQPIELTDGSDRPTLSSQVTRRIKQRFTWIVKQLTLRVVPALLIAVISLVLIGVLIATPF